MLAANRPKSLLVDALSAIQRETGADVVLIGEFLDTPIPRIRTTCCVQGGQRIDDFSFPLLGDPLQEVAEGHIVSILDGARQDYPSCWLLRDFKASSVAAMPIPLEAGQRPGVIALYWAQGMPSHDAAWPHLTRLIQATQDSARSLYQEIELERSNSADQVRNQVFSDYIQETTEGFTVSEYMPPIPLDSVTEEELIDRLCFGTFITDCNRIMARMWGFQRAEDVIGLTPNEVVGEERMRRNGALWVRQKFQIRDMEGQTVDANGEVTWIRGTLIGHIRNGKLTHAWNKRSDITAQKRYEAAIHRKAQTDPLTGLPNRYWFQDRIDDLMRDHTARNKEFCLGLLDLNGFKEINDTLGHLVGDQILQAMSVRLLKGLKLHGAEMARLGGDEFAILMPELSHVDKAETMARELQELLTEPFVVENMPLKIGGSLGLAMFSESGTGNDDLLRLADIAMYAAKNDGQPYRWYHPDIDRHSKRRLSLLNSLSEAIQAGELFLVYQPKIDVWNKELSGFEALLRWAHPSMGLIPPNEFIPYAETNEVILPLTRWVIAEAIRQGAAWLAAGHRIKMAVNISVRNLLDDQLEDHIANCLQDSGLPADLLELEVTESALMTHPAQAMELLHSLRALGISIAIDDFGTGYSSLAYLARLPVTTLKVDQAFVKDMLRSSTDEQIVRSIIGLAHQCQLTVVAEGVEDEASLSALLNMGCDHAQGYHIGRPMPVADVEGWISQHRVRYKSPR